MFPSRCASPAARTMTAERDASVPSPDSSANSARWPPNDSGTHREWVWLAVGSEQIAKPQCQENSRPRRTSGEVAGFTARAGKNGVGQARRRLHAQCSRAPLCAGGTLAVRQKTIHAATNIALGRPGAFARKGAFSGFRRVRMPQGFFDDTVNKKAGTRSHILELIVVIAIAAVMVHSEYPGPQSD